MRRNKALALTAVLALIPAAAVASQLTFHEVDLGPGPAFPRDAAHRQPTHYEPTRSCCASESGEGSLVHV